MAVYSPDHYGPQHGWQEHLHAFIVHSGTFCFVPCDQEDMSLVDGLLVQVGEDECRIKGLSAFVTEMVETAAKMRVSREL